MEEVVGRTFLELKVPQATKLPLRCKVPRGRKRKPRGRDGKAWKDQRPEQVQKCSQPESER